jgi:Niemann-Pick C1 protein
LFQGKGEGSQQLLGEKFAKTLAHSGVAITITSVTDVVAFTVGGSTILPALRSFCFFAAVGIFAVFFFQVEIS